MANVRIQRYFVPLHSPGQDIILCFSLLGLWFNSVCGCITSKVVVLLWNLKFTFGCFGKERAKTNSKVALYSLSSKKPSRI